VSFYAAGSLADAGTPALAYDAAAHLAAEEHATTPGISYQFFYYPPVFLLLCAPLARLPYLASFLLFEAATLVPAVLVGRRILGERGWAALAPMLAFPPVLWTLGLGQNAFLTAALFGAATLLVERRPVVAGLLLGALCYKPHFGLLVPVALAAGGHWRAFAAAAGSALGLALLSLGLFGWETWHAFFLTAAGSPATYESGRIQLAGMVSPFAAVRLLGGGPQAAYAVQAAATLGAAALVGSLWRRGSSLPVRAAALAAGTALATPVILVYDLVLAAVALAWLVRAGSERGFLPWEKSILMGLFAVALLSYSAAVAWRAPLAPLVPATLLALAVARGVRERTAPLSELAVPA
jgi:hypothetical protein